MTIFLNFIIFNTILILKLIISFFFVSFVVLILYKMQLNTDYIETLGKEIFTNYIVYTNRFVNIPNPIFSIIVPVFKESKIIANNLEIFNLDIRKKYNFELIVSDGGSDDGTIDIAKTIADKVVVHNANYRQTIAEGRNNGVEVAKSNIFVFLNVDTLPKNLDDFFEIIYEFSKANNKYSKFGALACKVSGFPDEIILKDKIFYFLHNSYVNFLNIIGFGMGRGECQVVRKDIFEQSGCYNNSIVAGEDFDLYHRISKISKIKFEPKLFVYESPRRFRRYGYLRTLGYWITNALCVLFLKRSYSKEWEAIR